MVINGIDFHKKILSAINKNELVVFAGAGVSKSAPTSLPGFEELADEVGNRNNMVRCKTAVEIDEFLGDVVRNHSEADIKGYIAERLGNKTTKPNTSHDALIDLFREEQAIRIVTTNQDLMFEKALKRKKIAIPVYNAPALPYGDDFFGIVHLHGSVEEPKHMVFTDDDFGNAYMMKGYASRFLIELFSKYTVLFWGYSYNDRIVRYLTTSITAKRITDAFILSDSGECTVYDRTNIEIINYPKDEHRKAREAIQTLGKYAKRGILDWKQRINTFDNDPPIDKEMQDEILEGIKDLSIQKLFCKDVKGKKWVAWLDGEGVFSELFEESKTLSEAGKRWGRWLSENFYSDVLLSLIEKHGNQINEEFCYMILNQFGEIDKAHSNQLFATYASIVRKKINQFVYKYNLVLIAEKRGMHEYMWLLFWECCEYTIVLKSDFEITAGEEKVSATYQWRVDYHLLNELWKNCVSKHILDPAKVLYMCTSILEKLYTDITEIGKNTSLLDLLDIEHNEQELYRDDCTFIICCRR